MRGKKEFIINEKGAIIGRQYDTVGNPKNINGLVFFRAELGGKQFIVNENGQKVGGVYEYVSLPQNIHGTIAFWACSMQRCFTACARHQQTPAKFPG
jgi:hypothetical protein